MERQTGNPPIKPAPLEHKLAAVLYADVAGYSRLTGEDEEGTHRILRAYLDAFTAAIQAHHGTVKHYAGDAVLADFPTVSDALNCAVAIQRDLKARNEALPEARLLQFRIGVNLGEVIVDGGEVYGNGVNVAARLESLAEPGGICVSGTVVDAIGTMLPLTYAYLGEQQVKNIDKPVRAYRVITEGRPGPAVTRPRRRLLARRSLILASAVALVLGIAGAWLWRSVLSPRLDSLPALSAAASVAVLPFDNLSGDAGQDYFADGITEELITSLSRFRNLRVTARHSTSRYKGQVIDIGAIGRELRVRYLVEGSVRRSPEAIRITAQLIEAGSAAHLWAETYQRPITPSNILDIQQEIASKIAAAIGGDVGVVVMKEFQDSRGKPPANLSAYECNLRALAYIRTVSVEDHKAVRDCLERAVASDPGYADAWSNLAVVYLDEDRFGYNARPGGADRALKAVQRAAQLAPDSQFVQDALIVVHFYRGELDAFLAAADRAVALNPNNPLVLADAGMNLAYAGQWEKGLSLLDRAIALEPNPPGWYYNAAFFDHYRKGEYGAALAEAQKINMPDYVWAQASLAAAYGQLGRVEEAKPYVQRILELDPAFEATARQKRWKWFRYQEPLLDHFMEGLRKAGLKIPLKDK